MGVDGNLFDRQRQYISRALKFVVVILCLVGFVFNSYYIFKQFIGHQTVTSFNIQENLELYLPSITLCGTSGYKEQVDEYSDLRIENYVNNTIGITDILISNAPNKGDVAGKLPVQDTLLDELGQWRILTTYSAYRGRCYTIEYREKVISSFQNTFHKKPIRIMSAHFHLRYLHQHFYFLQIYTGYCNERSNDPRKF